MKLGQWAPKPGDRVLVGRGKRAHLLVVGPGGIYSPPVAVACNAEWWWRDLSPAPEGTPECRKCRPANAVVKRLAEEGA